MKKLFAFILLFAQSYESVSQFKTADANELNQRLAKGWNTWSYDNMLTHALLPEGLAVSINFRQTFIGSPYDPEYFLQGITSGKDARIKPIAHAFDGSYTELQIDNWKENVITIQSTSIDDEVYILVTPEKQSATRYTLEIESGLLWNREGALSREHNTITAHFPDRAIVIRSTRSPVEGYFPYRTPYLCLRGDSAVGVYTGKIKTHAEVVAIVERAKQTYYEQTSWFGERADVYQAIQSVIGWNTIYDAGKNRVITPVTRGWNEAWQGYVLFEWDTFFGALLASTGSKDLAYSNVFAVTKGPEKGHVGFWQMPGMEAVQSQPPVGSLVCWMLYEKYHEEWFLEEVYDDLLEWNRWWIKNRLYKGYLTWGAPWKGADHRAVILESGLDNSPMYEDAKIVEMGNASFLAIADVGLNSLYTADCIYLAKIAEALGKKSDARELNGRAREFAKKTGSLWDEQRGAYLNIDHSTNTFSDRLTPTLFYPMIAGIPSREQANRMIKEHFYNRQEFYGDYILPSCARNDPSFDNNYWRGSIWGPMNYLVYLGMKNYDAEGARDIAAKSLSLFRNAWQTHKAVYENTNSETGASQIKDQLNCDVFYHWGALMGLMDLQDHNNTHQPGIK